MPIVTLKYTLPDELSEFKIASRANEYYAVITDTDAHVRQLLKYDHSLDEKTIAILENIRDFLKIEDL